MELPANTILTGDSTAVLDDLPADSVHAIVTDPPYGLAFMGRDWDDFSPTEYQQWCEEWAAAALRVLKPGGHLLAFSGNRTHHRLFCGVENAGYTVRDTLTWHYGTGFPKGRDIGKVIDKQEGAEDDREVVGTQQGNGVQPGHGNYVNNNDADWNEGGFDITEPATDAAEQWDGWNTQLKPSTEFIVCARAPLAESSIAANVRAHGTGALNIDACRIDTDDDLEREQGYDITGGNYNQTTEESTIVSPDRGGRYPANLVLDELAAGRLDAQSGECETGDVVTSSVGDGAVNFNTGRDISYRSGETGASRFFYTGKATKAERTLDGRIDNAHPTVKPSDLMEWLVRLVTAEGQVVLDPFAGTGTTCKAAKDLGRDFVGIEQQERWADVARVRCGLSPDDPAHVRPEDSPQQGLEAFADGGQPSEER